MNRELAINYLQSSGFSDEQIKAIEGAFTCDKCVYSTNEGCQYDDITETIPPFDDCISRQAAIDAITKTSGIRADALKALCDVPPVTPQPKMGYWIDITNKHGTVIAVRCSHCNESPKHAIKSDFCPNCGVKMGVKA